MQTIDAIKNPPPKDGTLLYLLVRADRDNWHPTEDSEVFRTIGFNDLENTGEDRWQCAGWNWCGDCFTETTGEIIEWAMLPDIPTRLASAE